MQPGPPAGKYQKIVEDVSMGRVRVCLVEFFE
jgi:hypothetical protein